MTLFRFLFIFTFLSHFGIYAVNITEGDGYSISITGKIPSGGEMTITESSNTQFVITESGANVNLAAIEAETNNVGGFRIEVTTTHGLRLADAFGNFIPYHLTFDGNTLLFEGTLYDSSGTQLLTPTDLFLEIPPIANLENFPSGDYTDTLSLTMVHD